MPYALGTCCSERERSPLQIAGQILFRDISFCFPAPAPHAPASHAPAPHAPASYTICHLLFHCIYTYTYTYINMYIYTHVCIHTYTRTLLTSLTTCCWLLAQETQERHPLLLVTFLLKHTLQPPLPRRSSRSPSPALPSTCSNIRSCGRRGIRR